MPQMDGVVDPTLSTPNPRKPRKYRGKDDKDDNPYASGPRPRISRQFGGNGRAHGKADKCPSWEGHSTENWQEYRTTLQAWNAANQEFMNMTPAQTLQKMCQVFREAGETAPADSLNFLLVEYQQPPPLDVVLRDIDSLFKVNTVANTLDILGEFNFSSNSATETN